MQILALFFFFRLVFYILSIKQRMFNISIDSSFLNIFSSSLSHYLQIGGRNNVLPQIYYIFSFLNSPYFLHLVQQIFIILIFLKSIQKKINYRNYYYFTILHIFLIKINLYNLANFKLVFVLEYCQLQNYQSMLTLLAFTCKAPQWVSVDSYSSRFITYAQLLFWVNYFLNKHH